MSAISVTGRTRTLMVNCPRLLLSALVSLIMLGAVAPPTAKAGSYPVYVCGGPAQNNALAFSESTNHISQSQWCGGAGIQVWSNASVS
ncbi:MAG: hypothetical protein ACYC0H_18640, partial [Solirubrobacteraceae bacterium]